MPPSPSTLDWFPVLLLGVLALAFLFAPLGAVPLFDKDEGAFCEATREMLLSGDYLMTYLNGAPRYDKPILIYWLQALSASVLGLSEFALRLPSALATLLWSVVLYRFGAKYFDRDSALIAAIILLTSAQITVVAKAAIADALLNLFIASSMFTLYGFYDYRKKRYLVFASMLVALGTLTKGPIAVLVPLLTTLVYCLSYRRLDLWRESLTYRWAWLAFLAVALPWPIAAYLDQGNALIRAWVIDQTVNRAAAPMEGHGGSVFYYIPVVLLGFLPFTFPMGGVLASSRALWRNPLDRYLLCWFGIVFIMFSLIGTKLPHYVVYGYTPLFLLTARRITELQPRWTLAVPAFAVSAILAALPSLLPAIRGMVDDLHAQDILEDAGSAFGSLYYAVLATACALALAACVRRFPVVARTAAAGASVALAVNYALMPSAAELLQCPVQEAGLFARELDEDVAMFEPSYPSFVFYSERIQPTGWPKPGGLVFVRREKVLEWKEQGFIRFFDPVFSERGFLIGRVEYATTPE